MASELVGASVFHGGEHGVITSAMMMAEPMVSVAFPGRVAIMKPSELGSR